MPFVKFVYGLYRDAKNKDDIDRSLIAGLISMALTYAVFYFAGLFEYAQSL